MSRPLPPADDLSFVLLLVGAVANIAGILLLLASRRIASRNLMLPGLAVLANGACWAALEAGAIRMAPGSWPLVLSAAVTAVPAGLAVWAIGQIERHRDGRRLLQIGLLVAAAAAGGAAAGGPFAIATGWAIGLVAILAAGILFLGAGFSPSSANAPLTAALVGFLAFPGYAAFLRPSPPLVLAHGIALTIIAVLVTEPLSRLHPVPVPAEVGRSTARPGSKRDRGENHVAITPPAGGMRPEVRRELLDQHRPCLWVSRSHRVELLRRLRVPATFIAPVQVGTGDYRSRIHPSRLDDLYWTCVGFAEGRPRPLIHLDDADYLISNAGQQPFLEFLRALRPIVEHRRGSISVSGPFLTADEVAEIEETLGVDPEPDPEPPDRTRH